MTSAPYRSSRQTQLHISTESWPCTRFPCTAYRCVRVCVGASVNTSELQQRTCSESDRSFSSDLRWNTGLDYPPPLLWTPFSEDTCYLAYWGLNIEVSALFACAENVSLLIFFSGSFSSCKGNPKSRGIIRSYSCVIHLPCFPSFLNHNDLSKQHVWNIFGLVKGKKHFLHFISWSAAGECAPTSADRSPLSPSQAPLISVTCDSIPFTKKNEYR